MDTITYSLKDSRPDSEMYYQSVAGFTDKVLSEAAKLLQPAVDLYKANLIKSESLYTEEAYLELLIMGVYWKTYCQEAVGLGTIHSRLLANISRLREKQGVIRSGVDFFKGIVTTLFLVRPSQNKFTVNYEVKNLGKLIAWLEASGEYRQEVKRLKIWKEYLSGLSCSEAAKVISATVNFASWFEEQSQEALGTFTQRVNGFLSEKWPEHYWHEDVIFCGSRRAEYHLNMVGAEIMNRIYHSDFAAKRHKVMLLPTCMCKPDGSKCMAKPYGASFVCAGCSKGCSVNSLTQFGRTHALQVKLVRHESSIASTKTDDSLFDTESGVIGVSCVLNLISGGWMLIEKGAAPQCVLLDYCGCKNHWHKEGITTSINEKQLQRILDD